MLYRHNMDTCILSFVKSKESEDELFVCVWIEVYLLVLVSTLLIGYIHIKTAMKYSEITDTFLKISLQFVIHFNWLINLDILLAW